MIGTQHIKSIQQTPFGSMLKDRAFQDFKNFRYKFNGKESDGEINGENNSYDFGARIYDNRLGRWLSVDPEFKRYAYCSPYVAFGDNPIYYIDPSGEILKVAGDEKARETARAALQTLTNDKVMIDKDGIVTVVAGNENPGKKLSFGTRLISEAVVNKQTTTIIISDANKTSANQEAMDSGVPTDAIVEWNPNETKGGIDVNGGTTRPAEIGLAHEVVHAVMDMFGSATDDENQLFGDPDDNGQDSNMGVSEVNTRLAENEIRKEQGLPLRKIPEGVNRETGEKINTSVPIPTPPPKGKIILNAPKKILD